jgi:proteic killer suppression protein
MIIGFVCADTERLWETGKSRSLPPAIWKRAWMKLAMLNAATSVTDLRVPPGNQLEALKHDRIGQHSIRVNQKYRVCFVWKDGNAYQVEIVDYH